MVTTVVVFTITKLLKLGLVKTRLEYNENTIAYIVKLNIVQILFCVQTYRYPILFHVVSFWINCWVCCLHMISNTVTHIVGN